MNGDSAEKPPRRKRRSRDNNLKTQAGKAGADRFIEEVTGRTGKGKITHAAQAAYPNQKRGSAAATGSRLLKDPYVQEQIRLRQRAMAEVAAVNRDMLIGNLNMIIYGSLDDVTSRESGLIDWEKAKDRGVAHLIQEITVTDRHAKDGSSRKSTTYKVSSKMHAMDLLTELTGWKKQPQKNPVDAARETFNLMRQQEQFAQLEPEHLAALIIDQKYPTVTIDEILAA